MRYPSRMTIGALAAALSMALAPAGSAAAPLDDGKKGVSAAGVDGAADALRDVRAGWFYTWAADAKGIKADGREFVPMIWGKDSASKEQLDKAKSSGTTLLGFNEPDGGGQANMSVDKALELWPKLQDTGMRLGAPAVAGSGDKPGGWLDTFMSGAGKKGYRVDFIPVHWYGSDFSPAAVDQLRGYLRAVHDRYHKPVWLTEYALIDFSSGKARYPSAEEQQRFVKDSKGMLEGESFVERYAWFTLSTATSPTGLYDGAKANASGSAYRG